MTTAEKLALYGVGIQIVGETNIKLTGLHAVPEDLRPALNALIEEARVRKTEIILEMRSKGARQVLPEEGEQRTITFDSADVATMKRWAVALEAGLIQLDGKIQVSEKSGIVHLRYRCVLPGEWLQDAVTAATKQQYNAILERAKKAEEWLVSNPDDPRYERAYDAYLAMFDDLKQLYNAVGEAMTDPYAGYEGVAVR